MMTVSISSRGTRRQSRCRKVMKSYLIEMRLFVVNRTSLSFSLSQKLILKRWETPLWESGTQSTGGAHSIESRKVISQCAVGIAFNKDRRCNLRGMGENAYSVRSQAPKRAPSSSFMTWARHSSTADLTRPSRYEKKSLGLSPDQGITARLLGRSVRQRWMIRCS